MQHSNVLLKYYAPDYICASAWSVNSYLQCPLFSVLRQLEHLHIALNAVSSLQSFEGGSCG